MQGPQTHSHFEGDSLLQALRRDLKQLCRGLDLPGAHHRGHLLGISLCETRAHKPELNHWAEFRKAETNKNTREIQEKWRTLSEVGETEY